jgi:hypothetical protein
MLDDLEASICQLGKTIILLTIKYSNISPQTQDGKFWNLEFDYSSFSENLELEEQWKPWTGTSSPENLVTRINLPENLESPIKTGSHPESPIVLGYYLEPENLESPIRIESYPELENLESPIRIGSYPESPIGIGYTQNWPLTPNRPHQK